ncbi:isoprenoid synthase domain-containing protein [Xylariales sp. PMI_506]|nr:isoprenoid synthase domain-containing protein [Xylariales sp. PMI_506]
MATTVITAPPALSLSVSMPEQHDNEIEVILPDLFTSIMSVDITVNKHYEQVKVEACDWVAKSLGYSEKQSKRNAKADFTYLVAHWSANCDAEALRTMVDWQHWAFPFDDEFDEGKFKEDMLSASEEIIHMTSLLDDAYPPLSFGSEHPVRYGCQLNWYYIKKRASKELQHRYKEALKHYMLGILGQVNSRCLDPKELSVDAYLKFRRGTIGANPCFSLVEYAEGIKVPQYAMDHPSIAICKEVCIDLTLIDNDILSYKKDLLLGEKLNLVNVIRAQGYTLQEALDETGRMVNNCYVRWYKALAELPCYGQTIDREILRYLDGIRNVALGSLIWSFRTGRYFTAEEGAALRTTGKLYLPAKEAEEIMN